MRVPVRMSVVEMEIEIDDAEVDRWVDYERDKAKRNGKYPDTKLVAKVYEEQLRARVIEELAEAQAAENFSYVERIFVLKELS